MQILTRTIALVVAFIVTCIQVFAQQNLPTDYLSKTFHQGRREALRQLMPDNSVAVIFAYPERVFSNDVDYKYHPNPDLYYFTGYREPDAVLLIFKEQQQNGGDSYNELFYVRKRNHAREQWTGRRLGVEGVKTQLNIDHVFNSDEFKDAPIDFLKFSKVLYDDIDITAGGFTGQLIDQFCAKAKVAKTTNMALQADLTRIAYYTTPSNLAQRVKQLQATLLETSDEAYRNNPLIKELIAKPDTATLSRIIMAINSNPTATAVYKKMIGQLREIKQPEELVLLRKSVKLSSLAHAEVMKAIHPAMSETELEGIFDYVHKKYGAEDEGYPPIVGTGANGCILHYIENNSTKLGNQLVLMDVGSEYHGYLADVTRTVPASGKFTEAQKAIYQLVYDAQDSIFQRCKTGVALADLNDKATKVLAAGLIKLGIIKEAAEVRRYYPHGCSHHLGLDVHDKSASRMLKENMVITVEPGIYIPQGSPCDIKWWDIAVRIEDDVIIGKTSCTILSGDAPRKWQDVEKMAAEKSVFSDFTVPSL